jgi:hypothetical protein
MNQNKTDKNDKTQFFSKFVFFRPIKTDMRYTFNSRWDQTNVWVLFLQNDPMYWHSKNTSSLEIKNAQLTNEWALVLEKQALGQQAKQKKEPKKIPAALLRCIYL